MWLAGCKTRKFSTNNVPGVKPQPEGAPAQVRHERPSHVTQGPEKSAKASAACRQEACVPSATRCGESEASARLSEGFFGTV